MYLNLWCNFGENLVQLSKLLDTMTTRGYSRSYQ